jgi:lysophospholipase L1-like esterase
MKTKWTNVLDLGLCGRGWSDLASAYDRLPARADGVVPDHVMDLGRQSAGMWVDFRSDAPSLHARCMLRQPPVPEHHYIKYLDLYCRDEQGQWRWASASRYGFIPSGETPLTEGLSARMRDWRLYLPLTYKVERLEIGIPSDSRIEKVEADTRKPVVIYGTSIVHGCGHVSRPGMAWPSIAARRLDYPLINLGFSGSACMEPELGAIIAELDPAVFIIDPLANMSLELVEKNARPFLRHLVEARPRTPLLFIEDRTHANAWLNPDYLPVQQKKQAAFRAVADELQAEGFSVSYLTGADLIGTDGEATTDGSHPSDLGAMRYAETVLPILRKILINAGSLDS